MGSTASSKIGFCCSVLLLALVQPVSASAAAGKQSQWIAVWGCSAAEPFPRLRDSPIPEAPKIQGTVRYRIPVVQLGRRLQLRLTNEAGSAPLVVGAVSVGIAEAGLAAHPGSLLRVTFGSGTGIVIPAGAPALSDPIELPERTGTDLIVSVYLPQPAVQSQGQNGMLVGSIGARDATLESDPRDIKPLAARPLVSAVYTDSRQPSATVVTFGDSITDAAGSTSAQVRGWPGQLAVRMAKAGGRVRYGVSNQGIGGNRLLLDGIGANALARFDRDVASQPGASHVVVLLGINDIGIGKGSFDDFRFENGRFSSSAPPVNSAELIAAYQQLALRAHAAGLKIIGGTLLPFKGSFYYSEERERVRREVNDWIRSGGGFDAVIDFDQAVRNPADPGSLAAAYDSGDHLHPSDAGYVAMANAIDLRPFADSSNRR